MHSMSEWVPLDLINGWIADEDDPPRYRIENDTVMVLGSAISSDPSKAMARFPRELRPVFPVSNDEVSGSVIQGWTIQPDGYLYVWQKHILEGW